MKILTINDKKEAKFLRQKTAPFEPRQYSQKELRTLIQEMRQTMKEADGVGLSANQVGLNRRFFIAQLPAERGGPKFHVIFNPRITKVSKETMELEEGCLSVPQKWGVVKRAKKINIEGEDVNGKKIKIKAWGYLAQVFQHEIDHLDGALFIDKAKEVKEVKVSS